jgi:hypothetical protein
MVITVAALAVGWRTDASAQALSLQFNNGLVTLHAENVSLREIIERWSALGDVVITNRDGLSTTPLTLHLVALPERQALATLLRDMSGYILGARPQVVASVATVDRIVILPTSSAVKATAPAVATTPVVRDVTTDQFVAEQTPASVEEQAGAASGTSQAAGPQRPSLTQSIAPYIAGAATNTTPNPFGVLTGSAQPGTISPILEPSGNAPSPSQLSPPNP